MQQPPFYNLESIGFQRILPSPLLRPFVQWFWSIESSVPVTTSQQEFMHPHGSLSMVFNWGDDLKLNNGYYRQSVILERAGVYSRQVTLQGNIQAFGILFQPGGAFAFFDLPMEEIDNPNYFKHFHLHQLHEQLFSLKSTDKKVKKIEDWLIELLKKNNNTSALIPSTLKFIRNNYGQQPIADIAKHIHISERQLERVFKKEVGLSPKQYAKLMRLHQARILLKQANHSLTLTDIAYQTGFYDQAHFNRDFKKVVGITPRAYIDRLEGRAKRESILSLHQTVKNN